jgi:transketolase
VDERAVEDPIIEWPDCVCIHTQGVAVTHQGLFCRESLKKSCARKPIGVKSQTIHSRIARMIQSTPAGPGVKRGEGEMSPKSTGNRYSIDDICINTIRTLAMDAVQKADSGHPGAPMGLAAAGYVLWTKVLKHHPKNPQWPDRDRFVLSGGHASMLLYSLLHLTGYDLCLEEIKNFRQWGSLTPGHPEYGLTPGVETTTGPLGQGFANAVGMAMAERHLAAVFNQPRFPIVDHRTFVFCGDGDLMEGISHEAASLAGHLGLGKLICLYDDNKISIEGGTELAFTENVAESFKAMSWQVIRVEDGNSVDNIFDALTTAEKDGEHPSLIMLRTHIAYGSPNLQDSEKAHGSPLGKEEVALTKKALGCPPDAEFCVVDTALQHFRRCIDQGNALEGKWQSLFDAYSAAYPDMARRFRDQLNGILPEGWDNGLPDFTGSGPIATRSASGKVLNALAQRIPALIGGSADLAPSNETLIKGVPDFQKTQYHGRNIRFGVREHAMGGILSGMALHKGIRPYGGTFLVFADYMRPAIRLAALMKLPVIYVFTHDSIAVGEDGPTHQPVEHLASLHAIPNLVVIRPADATETEEAWRQALLSQDSPVALILSRQKLPVIDRKPTGCAPAHLLKNGGYILSEAGHRLELIMIATGSEISLALKAKERLESESIGVRLVNMPSRELFERMDTAYRKAVLPPEITARLSVEAGISMGWERYVGSAGCIIGMHGFGASAPGGVLMEKFGFTVDDIVGQAKKLLNR